LSHNDFFYNILTAKDKQRPISLIYQSWVENAQTEDELNWVNNTKKDLMKSCTI
jgi:hypothetical protein